MITTEEKIAVMRAYDEGKEIEYRPITNKAQGWNLCNPIWNWGDNEYRIKPKEPKTKLRPYANADEFLKAQIKHGSSIHWNRVCVDEHYFPISVTDKEVRLMGYTGHIACYCFDTIAKNCSWFDRTPCGVIEED